MGKKAIFITGHGRSGTTWIGNIFRQAKGVLYYNEPCNPDKAKGSKYSVWFRYVRLNANDPFFESYLDAAFKGLIMYKTAWLGQRRYRRLSPGYRIVIKEVASFMSLEWIYKRYNPSVLVVIRHPCAVALSERNKGTSTERPIMEILQQIPLVADHLYPFITVMKKAKKPFEIYGAIWAARNRVIANLLSHYPEWRTIFYEDLCKNPLGYFHELFDHFSLNWSSKVQTFINRTTTKKKLGTYSISRVTEKQIDKWKSEMTRTEIEQVRTFVEPFNLPFYNLESEWLYAKK
jgi:hypothetical protein